MAVNSSENKPTHAEEEEKSSEPAQRPSKMAYAVRFGEYVRAERGRCKRSVRSVAFEVGLEPSHLSKIERGVFPPPGVEKIQKLAEVLKIDGDELLAMSGHLAPDVMRLILEKPSALSTLIRAAAPLSHDEIDALISQCQSAHSNNAEAATDASPDQEAS